MEDRELISKKELLQITGISYGQLYRWKRENLIPEAWFIKQSSFTGQETFFPKDKILKRIEMIQELKDKYSLEELANMLSPELTNRSFRAGDLEAVPEIDPLVAGIFQRIRKKAQFTFMELLFIYILGSIRKELGLSESSLIGMAKSIEKWMPDIKGTLYRFIICRHGEDYIVMLAQQEAVLFMDDKTAVLKVFYMDELSKDINLKFNNLLEG